MIPEGADLPWITGKRRVAEVRERWKTVEPRARPVAGDVERVDRDLEVIGRSEPLPKLVTTSMNM